MANSEFKVRDVSSTRWNTTPSGFSSGSMVYQRVSGNVTIIDFALSPAQAKTADLYSYHDICTLGYSCLDSNGPVVTGFRASDPAVQFRINSNKLQAYWPQGWATDNSIRGQIVAFIV